ncbi:MAG: hypothetical protein NUW37_12935 [Planctomycetes bacterium]|nr:hypothetical protein [Planctomycetota bacterium]
MKTVAKSLMLVSMLLLFAADGALADVLILKTGVRLYGKIETDAATGEVKLTVREGIIRFAADEVRTTETRPAGEMVQVNRMLGVNPLLEHAVIAPDGFAFENPGYYPGADAILSNPKIKTELMVCVYQDYYEGKPFTAETERDWQNLFRSRIPIEWPRGTPGTIGATTFKNEPALNVEAVVSRQSPPGDYNFKRLFFRKFGKLMILSMMCAKENEAAGETAWADFKSMFRPIERSEADGLIVEDLDSLFIIQLPYAWMYEQEIEESRSVMSTGSYTNSVSMELVAEPRGNVSSISLIGQQRSGELDAMRDPPVARKEIAMGTFADLRAFMITYSTEWKRRNVSVTEWIVIFQTHKYRITKRVSESAQQSDINLLETLIDSILFVYDPSSAENSARALAALNSFDLGVAAVKRRAIAEAETAFAAALQSWDTFAEVYIVQAHSYFGQRAYDKAFEMAEKALGLWSTNGRYRSLGADCAIQLAKISGTGTTLNWDDMLKYAQKATSYLEDDDPRRVILIREMNTACGRRVTGQQTIQELEGIATYVENIRKLFRDSEQNEFNVTLSNIKARIGDAYQKDGNDSRARRAYRDSLELNPNNTQARRALEALGN